MSAPNLARLIWRENRASAAWHAYADHLARRSLCKGAWLNRSVGRRRRAPQGPPCRVCAEMLHRRGLPLPVPPPSPWWNRPMRHGQPATCGHCRHDVRVLVAVASSFAPSVRPAIVDCCQRCGAVTDAIPPADLHGAGVRLVAGHLVRSG